MDKKAMYDIGYGLYVLTAKEGDKSSGCIINTVMQVADNPIRVAISINKGNKTHDMIMESGRFNLSALTTKTPFSLFQRFGMQSGRDVNKFIGFEDVERADNGIYRLSAYSNAYLSCKLLRTVDLGSHTIFITELEAAQVLSQEEACTYGYYQSDIKPKPQPAQKKGWVCSVCGHVYEGEQLPDDYICPLCRHGKEDFRPLE